MMSIDKLINRHMNRQTVRQTYQPTDRQGTETSQHITTVPNNLQTTLGPVNVTRCRQSLPRSSLVSILVISCGDTLVLPRGRTLNISVSTLCFPKYTSSSGLYSVLQTTPPSSCLLVYIVPFFVATVHPVFVLTP